MRREVPVPGHTAGKGASDSRSGMLTHLLHLRTCVLNLGTIDTWGCTIQRCGAILCTVGCSAALASAHQMPVAHPFPA